MQQNFLTFPHPASRLVAGRAAILIGLALLGSTVLAPPLLAQNDGYVPQDGYVLEIDGALDESASIYYAQRNPSYLVVSKQLSAPLLLVPRTRVVQTVNLMKMSQNADGSIALMANPASGTLGTFDIKGTEIAFDVEGQRVRLMQKPDLMGDQSLEQMLSYSKSYAELAKAYEPKADTMDALSKVDNEVVVKVYFGSWCPFCGRYVPRIMKVAQELENDNIDVRFYGLPRGIRNDEQARALRINAVPTGVVWVDGKEAGRIENEEWHFPENEIREIAGR